MQKSTKYVTKPTQQHIMMTIILTRFPLSSEVRGPRVVLHGFLGGDDVSPGPWNP